jgi:hypothetical protein
LLNKRKELCHSLNAWRKINIHGVGECVMLLMQEPARKQRFGDLISRLALPIQQRLLLIFSLLEKVYHSTK